jgi:hypothetical protein
MTEQRRTLAYIISIDRYKSSRVQNLRGCRNDGEKFVQFLRNRLRVPPSQVQRLYDEAATSHGIRSLFDEVLSNRSIRKGDLVIFFYTGHSGLTQAQREWVAEDGRVAEIIPHDWVPDRAGNVHNGITGLVVGNILRDLATKREANVVRLR